MGSIPVCTVFGNQLVYRLGLSTVTVVLLRFNDLLRDDRWTRELFFYVSPVHHPVLGETHVYRNYNLGSYKQEQNCF